MQLPEVYSNVMNKGSRLKKSEWTKVYDKYSKSWFFSCDWQTQSKVWCENAWIVL